MTSANILIVVTSHAVIGDSGRATGLWLEELTTPYYAFVDAGARVDIASIRGGEVPIDPNSISDNGDKPASVERFRNDAAAMRTIQASAAIDSLAADDYDAIFLPGGHGTMWDLPDNSTLADLLSRAWAAGKVLGAVCHGPAGLVNVKDSMGHSAIAGRRLTAFSNNEEKAAGLDQAVPFMLETRLRELGALYERGDDFHPYAVRDGHLVTGQNPMSSAAVAQLILEILT